MPASPRGYQDRWVNVLGPAVSRDRAPDGRASSIDNHKPQGPTRRRSKVIKKGLDRGRSFD